MTNSEPAIEISALPVDHPLRNKTLLEIGAKYKNRNGNVWQEVKPSYGIAKCTFNQLGEAWIKYDIWIATIAI